MGVWMDLGVLECHIPFSLSSRIIVSGAYLLYYFEVGIPKIVNEVGIPKIVNEYDQEIPQSQTADNPMAPRGRAAQPSQDTRETN